jgi:hypothetical protein
MLDDVKRSLNRKVGPLPVWAWGVIIAGTLALILYWRRAQTPDSAETYSDTSTTDTVSAIDGTTGGGTGGEGIIGGDTTPGYTIPGYPDYPSYPSEPSPDTGGGAPITPPVTEVPPIAEIPSTPAEAGGVTSGGKSQDLSSGTMRWNFGTCRGHKHTWPGKTVWKPSDAALFKGHLNCRGITLAEFKARNPKAAAFFGW